MVRMLEDMRLVNLTLNYKLSMEPKIAKNTLIRTKNSSSHWINKIMNNQLKLTTNE